MIMFFFFLIKNFFLYNIFILKLIPVTNRLLHASINSFFNKNPIGKVLNRMSGDIERIDRYLPMTNSYVFLITSRVIVSLVLISIISNPLFLVFVFIYMFIALRMQRHYSLANIEATRLESITRSPFFQLFTDSGSLFFF